MLALVLLVASCAPKADETVPAGPAGPAAPSAESPAAPEGDEGLPTVAVCQVGDQYDPESEDVTNQTTTFTPDTPAMHVSAGITGLTTGATIRGSLRAVDVTDSEGTRIQDYEVASHDLDAPGEESTVHFEFSAPDAGWPVGSYAIYIAVGDSVIETIEVTVEQAA